MIAACQSTRRAPPNPGHIKGIDTDPVRFWFVWPHWQTPTHPWPATTDAITMSSAGRHVSGNSQEPSVGESPKIVTRLILNSMNFAAQAAAVLAGLLHVAIFTMESVLFRRPQIFRRFLTMPGDVDAVRPWALNQGFYNLF